MFLIAFNLRLGGQFDQICAINEYLCMRNETRKLQRIFALSRGRNFAESSCLSKNVNSTCAEEVFFRKHSGCCSVFGSTGAVAHEAADDFDWGRCSVHLSSP